MVSRCCVEEHVALGIHAESTQRGDELEFRVWFRTVIIMVLNANLNGKTGERTRSMRNAMQSDKRKIRKRRTRKQETHAKKHTKR